MLTNSPLKTTYKEWRTSVIKLKNLVQPALLSETQPAILFIRPYSFTLALSILIVEKCCFTEMDDPTFGWRDERWSLSFEIHSDLEVLIETFFIWNHPTI